MSEHIAFYQTGISLQRRCSLACRQNVPTWGGVRDVTSQRTSAQEARLGSTLLVSVQGLLVTKGILEELETA